MTTTTKTKAQSEPEVLPHVEIESGSGRFVPPPADLLPDGLHEARDLVLACRAAWLAALSRKRVADRVARDAKMVHKAAMNTAALEGENVLDVPDQRPAKYAAQAAATEAAKAAEAAASTRWRQLADLIAEHRDRIVANVTPSVEQAQAALLDLEIRAAEQRRITERLVAQRNWLSSITRTNTGRPNTETGSPFQ